MDNEKLIEYVREYTFLYDLNDRRYNDNQKKDAAWKEISKKLKISEKDCKKSWALLRDAFRRAMKKQKETKSGQASSTCKKWKYQEEMSFLLPYFKERPTVCTVTRNENNDEEDVSLDVEDSNETVDPTSDGESASNNPTNSESQSTPSVSKRQQRISKKPRYDETPSTTLMKYILENKKETSDIEQFFTSIATTVKSFPLRERAIAKAKVFEVISKMEMEILSKPSSGVKSPESFHSNDSSRRSYSPLSPAHISEPINNYQLTPQDQMQQLSNDYCEDSLQRSISNVFSPQIQGSSSTMHPSNEYY